MSNIDRRYGSPLFHRGEYSDEKGRDFYFDNAKFLLIFLVVLAHALSPLQASAAAGTEFHNYFIRFLWRAINIMHMPCLIFISGYFAKRYIRNGVINVQRPFTYAILYLASQISVGAFEVLVLRNTITPSIFNARSSLWFLQCLFWWYLLLPIISRFKPGLVMTAVIALGLFVGYDKSIGNFLAFSRMIVHLPFFMAGYYITPDMIKTLFTKKSKLLSIPAAIIPLVGIYFIRGDFVSSIITCNVNFWDLGINSINPLLWWCVRAWFYASAALLCFAFLVWVPRCWTIFTKFGSRTLNVYILHRFLYLAEREYQWWVPFNSPLGAVAMAGIAVAVTVIFSLRIFSYPFEWLQSIKVTGLLKEDK